MSETTIQSNDTDSFMCQVSKICCGCFAKVSLFTAVIVWTVFSIIALSKEQDSAIKEICQDSNLWACLCVMVVLNVINILTNAHQRNDDDKGKKNSIQLACLSVAGFIWMGVELFQSCAWSKLRDNQVWTLLAIWFSVETFIIGILILGCIVATVSLLFTQVNEQPQTKEQLQTKEPFV